MAVGVVDILEVVEVQVENRVRIGTLGRRSLELLEHAPVSQPGQVVDACLVAHALKLVFLFPQVPESHDGHDQAR